jgi:type III restriction enzyme
LAKNGIVTEHIIKQMSRAIYYWQEDLMCTAPVVEQTPFSSVDVLRMRESCSLELQKTIYERLPFPSHGGGLEKAFMEFLDKNATVERFVKINETQHLFAQIYYVRSDGMMATYHPDFLVGTAQNIYLVETKGENQLSEENVRLKQKAALNWVKEINELPEEERMNRKWEYVLLGENVFYSLSANGANITEICERCKVSRSAVWGNLFS